MCMEQEIEKHAKQKKVRPIDERTFLKLLWNPIGKHNSEINDPALCPPEIKQEVMDYVQTYIY